MRVLRFARTCCITDGNWSGQRKRFFRNLSLCEWQALYGRNYVYSSDFVLSHPQAFRRSTRTLATCANLLDEAGEAMQRLSTWHIRTAGSIIPGTMRELGTKGRFCLRLRKALARYPGPLTMILRRGAQIDRLHGALRAAGVINGRSQLTCDLSDPQTIERLQDCLRSVLRPRHDPCDSEFSLDPGGFATSAGQLLCALREADMRTYWSQLSLRRKVAHTAGASLAVASTLGCSALLLLYSTSVAGSFLGKWLAMASLLYAASFMLRLAAVAQARLMRTHTGMVQAPDRTERSLYETIPLWLYRLRNRLYSSRAAVRNRLPDDIVEIDGMCVNRFESNSPSFSVRRDASKARSTFGAHAGKLYTVAVIEGMQRAGDLFYNADGNGMRLIGRSLRGLFCAEQEFRQIAGQTASAQAAFEWVTPGAQSAFLGSARLALARFVGIGGVDVLAGGISCMAVSATWTAVNSVTGGAGTLALVNGLPLIAPLSGSLLGAAAWMGSAFAEIPLLIAYARPRPAPSDPQNAGSSASSLHNRT